MFSDLDFSDYVDLVKGRGLGTLFSATELPKFIHLKLFIKRPDSKKIEELTVTVPETAMVSRVIESAKVQHPSYE